MSYKQERRLRMVQLFETAAPLMSSSWVQEAGTVSQYRTDHTLRDTYRYHVEKSPAQIPLKRTKSLLVIWRVMFWHHSWAGPFKTLFTPGWNILVCLEYCLLSISYTSWINSNVSHVTLITARVSLESRRHGDSAMARSERVDPLTTCVLVHTCGRWDRLTWAGRWGAPSCPPSWALLRLSSSRIRSWKVMLTFSWWQKY